MIYKGKNKILIYVAAMVLIYLSVCVLLFFFEPAEYNAPNLSSYEYYFDSYSKFSKENNDNCYIKQISSCDVVSADDKRIKYVDNTVIAIAEEGVSIDEVSSLLSSYDHDICGLIPDVNFYQITFTNNLNYDELSILCQNLTDSDIFKIVIPDYFEETPAQESTNFDYSVNSSYYDKLGLEEAWTLLYEKCDVNVGIIDFYVDSSNSALNVINSDTYSSDNLYDEYSGGVYQNSVSHGTHVAGIIGASHDSRSPGVIDYADIYSYNGINVSTSYWIASVYDMIVNNDVKVINVSMGYNPYITISAALGCENALNHINNEQHLFSALLENIIDNGYEFVICAAAGNENTTSAYRIFNGYFSYGDKKLLGKLDLFGIFDKKPSYVDASFAYFFSSVDNKKVSDRIIVVGAIDSRGEYCNFACVGNVDIAASGEDIFSCVLNSEYEYWTGTSMATPFVTGAAALVFSANPELSGAQVKDIILTSADETVLTGIFRYPVLNIGNALRTALSS